MREWGVMCEGMRCVREWGVMCEGMRCVGVGCDV